MGQYKAKFNVMAIGNIFLGLDNYHEIFKKKLLLMIYVYI